jgi:hypothetical protein
VKLISKRGIVNRNQQLEGSSFVYGDRPHYSNSENTSESEKDMNDSFKKIYTTDDFETMSWHDNLIRGFAFHRDFNNENSKFISDFVLNIDFIVEWLCTPNQQCQFKISPATLTFHDVTDLYIHIDPGRKTYQSVIDDLTIHNIERIPMEDQKVCLDRPYYLWTIHLDLMMSSPGSQITFGASGFTQKLLKAPILCDDQQIPYDQRFEMPYE